MFSKSYCPFCNEIKELFNNLGIKFHAVELDLREDGSEIQAGLLEKWVTRPYRMYFDNSW